MPSRTLFTTFASALIALAPQGITAAGVTNGDFGTGDFTGWTLDTDGSPGGPSDFSVVGFGPFAGRIEADFHATAGDITSTPSNAVFLANTLHQTLDTSALPGEVLLLSFDWTFDGEDGDAAAGETFLVGLGDGSGTLFGADGLPGHVVAPTSDYGGGSVEVALDPAAFNNVGGWSVEFQLGVGVDPAAYRPNANGSYVEIENVALPEPGGGLPLLAGVGALVALARLRRRRAAKAALAGLVAVGLASGASANWTDVSGSVDAQQTRPEYDRENDALASLATVTNTSGGMLGNTLRLVIADATFPVTNEDGRTGDFEPYYDVPALADGESFTARVAFERLRAPLSFSLRLEQLLPAATSLAMVSGPTITMDPNNRTPLAGLVEAETNVAAKAKLTITGGGDSWTVEFPEFQTVHALPVLGLKSGITYDVDVEFFDQNAVGISGGPTLQATTPALPSHFPNKTVFTSQPGQMEPGYTLIDRFGRESGDNDPRYITIFDAAGDLVWYGEFGGSDIQQAPNGHLRLGAGSQTAEEDMLGSVTKLTTLGYPGTLHHDLFHTAYGSFLSLGRTQIVEANYPTSYTDPVPTAQMTLLDEPAVEMDADGNVINQWLMSSLIDTTRIAYDSLNDSPNGGEDWVHANAVTHVPRDDSVLVSLRHQDAVLSFSRYTGKLKWILGTHENWKAPFQPFLLTPVGSPFEWQYHQHAPMLTDTGTIMLFDNGNHRASPYDGTTPMPPDQSYSRAVEYDVDEDSMEVTQVWEWGGAVSDPLYSFYISDADWLPQTGNVLVHFGGHTYYDNQLIANFGWGERAVRVVEVTRTTPAVKVFDMILYDSSPTGRVTAYRAERIPSLYPPNVIVTGP